MAIATNASLFGEGLKSTAEKTELGAAVDLPLYIAGIIKVLFTLIGIVFIALTIYGGFLYMTAMGESEKVKKGKNVIMAAIIGLIIIVSGYAITYFVTLQLEQPGRGIPGPSPTCENPGDLNYKSLNCCEYRFQRYGTADCCDQTDFCNAHISECGGTCP